MILLFKAAFLLSLGIFFVPKGWKRLYTIIVCFVLAITTTSWAVTALFSPEALVIDLGISFWKENPSLVFDKLSAFFTLLINFTCITGIIYGSGYLQPYFEKKSATKLSLHLFCLIWLQASMIQVVSMRDGVSFLTSWEMMSLSSFLLVIFEGDKETTLKTGINYLVQMHVGFICILLAFLLVFKANGQFGFDALPDYFADHDNRWIFLLFFTGFGIKAGFVPLHTWLPHAHPAAPSHVSGIMSGIMIKMGIYGILRIMTHVQSDFMTIGLFVLTISAVTGIIGILYSIFQHDLKKILAYSSIENIGIIGMGIGIAAIGKAMNNDVLCFLGLAGALFHILNHSLYKSMLFYAAGNVYYATHTRDQNQLGGIIRQMPKTALLFLLGSIAICGIPPFNGFISEFLLYSSAFQTIGKANFSTSLLSLGIILSLALIGGLSVYSFSKAFGLTFLGSRRIPHKEEPKEVPLVMRAPGYLIIALMASIGLFPYYYLNLISSVMSTFSHYSFSTSSITLIPSTRGALTAVSLSNLIFLGVFLLIMLLRTIRKKNIPVAYGPTWGCGYSAGDYKHQYTATSFADSLGRLTEGALMIERSNQIFKEEEIFPAARIFQTETKDLIEEKLVLKPVNKFILWIPRAGWAQTGMIHHYLIYPLAFIIIIGLLTLLKVF